MSTTLAWLSYSVPPSILHKYEIISSLVWPHPMRMWRFVLGFHTMVANLYAPVSCVTSNYKGRGKTTTTKNYYLQAPETYSVNIKLLDDLLIFGKEVVTDKWEIEQQQKIDILSRGRKKRKKVKYRSQKRLSMGQTRFIYAELSEATHKWPQKKTSCVKRNVFTVLKRKHQNWIRKKNWVIVPYTVLYSVNRDRSHWFISLSGVFCWPKHFGNHWAFTTCTKWYQFISNSRLSSVHRLCLGCLACLYLKNKQTNIPFLFIEW